MSPFTLLSLSAETARARADRATESTTCSGSSAERRWGLWTFVATLAVLTIAVAALHAG